jgi:hypothetical protein
LYRSIGSLSKSWTLVSNSGTVTYEPSFALATSDGALFEQVNDVWSYSDGAGTWTFSEATGVLSLATVPEPSTLALFGISIVTLLAYARRRRAV